MKLIANSLRVINCGPLRDIKIDFATSGASPLTVIGGANGSGKTTVLELIAALAELLNWPAVSTRKAEGQGILDRAEYAELNLSIDGKQANIVYQRDNAPVTAGPDSYLIFPMRTGRLGARAIASEVLQTLQTRIENPVHKFVEFASTDPDLETLTPSILFFPHLRFLTSRSGTQINKEQTDWNWVYRYQPESRFQGSLTSYLIQLDYAEPETYERVIDFLNGLNMDGKTFGPVDRKEFKVFVTTRDKQKHYLENLSSGEQNLLILLLELRRRLLPHSIVLIDEIENSLHPAFQYRLANALKRLQSQIPFQLIVTTHAPAFVEIFGTENTRILTEF